MKNSFRKDLFQKYGADKKRGVVLLITVVVASIVLTVGVGILNVILKEVILSSLNKGGRVAFFAADSGIECAMYWDTIDKVATSTHFKVGGYTDSFFPYGATTTGNFNGGNAPIPAGTWSSKGFCQNQTAQQVFVDNFGPADVSSWAGGSTMAVQNVSVVTTKFLLYTTGVVNSSKPCALVQVVKTIDGENVQTQIISEGFSSCTSSDIRRSTRGVNVQYSR
jgi:hypothetical protein